jgi:hypothetical protein
MAIHTMVSIAAATSHYRLLSDYKKLYAAGVYLHENIIKKRDRDGNSRVIFIYSRTHTMCV